MTACAPPNCLPSPGPVFCWVRFFLGLNKLGWFPRNALSEYTIQIGSMIEIWLLSFALGERINIEIAERQKAQDLAIRNLQQFENIYNNAVEGLFTYNIKSNRMHCNKAFAKLFELDLGAELPLKNNVLAYFSTEVQQELAPLLTESGYVKGYEAEIVLPISQITIWVALTIRLVKDSDGSDSSVEGAIIDISERKLKEQAEKDALIAEQYRLKAQQALELALKDKEISAVQSQAKSQFFASMSHEFRTPLTAILGYTRLAQDPGLVEGERLEHINAVKSSADHMLQLINDVLDLSKIEAQKMEIEVMPVKVFDLTQAVHDFIWILAHQNSLSFDIKYHLPLPESFMSDSMRLKQALVNLCSNSVKFTKHGGVTLEISCDPVNEKLIFVVRDTGIGMKPEHVEKLFQAFTQVDSSTSRNFGGTGLGLHLSKLIANKLGGDITVDSEFGKGSVFTMTVTTGLLSDAVWINEIPNKMAQTMEPIAVVQMQHAADSIGVDAAEHVVKVLLADDNLVNQKLVSFQLRQFGADVVLASDGLEAIAAAVRDAVDIIFMDMDMPAMDGLTAVRYLRSKGFTKPIYALTGNVDEASINACRSAGCDGHLTKPIDVSKLAAAVDTVRTDKRIQQQFSN